MLAESVVVVKFPKRAKIEALKKELLFSWASLEEASKWLSVSKQEVVSLCNQGKLHSAIMRKNCVVSIESINWYLEEKELGEDVREKISEPRIVSLGKMLTDKKIYKLRIGRLGRRNLNMGYRVKDIADFFEKDCKTVRAFLSACNIETKESDYVVCVDQERFETVLRRAGIINKQG